MADRKYTSETNPELATEGRGVKFAIPDAHDDTKVHVVTPRAALTAEENADPRNHHKSHGSSGNGSSGSGAGSGRGAGDDGGDGSGGAEPTIELHNSKFWLTFDDPDLERRYTHFAYVHSSFYGGKLWHAVAFLIVLLSFFYYHSIRHGFSHTMFIKNYWIAMTVTGVTTLGMLVCCFVESLASHREIFFLISLFTHWPAFTIALMYGLGPPFVYTIPILSGCFFFCTFVVQARFSRLIFFLTVSPLVTLIISTNTFPYNFWSVHRVSEIVYWGLLFFPVTLVHFFEVNSRRYYVQMETCEEKIKVIEAKIESTRNLIAHFFPFTPTKDLLTTEQFERCRRYHNTGMLVTDLAGFTAWTSVTEPPVVIETLGNMFNEMDNRMATYGVEKISTVGDCLIAAVFPRKHVTVERRAHNTILYSLAILPLGGALKLRIGVHVGSLTGGFVGTSPPKFEIFGDDVEVTKELEQGGVPGKVHISKKVMDSIAGEAKDAEITKMGGTAVAGWIPRYLDTEKSSESAATPQGQQTPNNGGLLAASGSGNGPLSPPADAASTLTPTNRRPSAMTDVPKADPDIQRKVDNFVESDGETSEGDSRNEDYSNLTPQEVFYISKTLVEMGNAEPEPETLTSAADQAARVTALVGDGSVAVPPLPLATSESLMIVTSNVSSIVLSRAETGSSSRLSPNKAKKRQGSSLPAPSGVADGANSARHRNSLPAPALLLHTPNNSAAEFPDAAIKRDRSSSLNNSANFERSPSSAAMGEAMTSTGSYNSLTDRARQATERGSLIFKARAAIASRSESPINSLSREKADDAELIPLNANSSNNNNNNGPSPASKCSNSARNSEKSGSNAVTIITVANLPSGDDSAPASPTRNPEGERRATTDLAHEESEQYSQGNEHEAVVPDVFHPVLLQFSDRIVETKFRFFLRKSGLCEKSQYALALMCVYLAIAQVLLGCFDTIGNRLIIAYILVALSGLILVFRWSMHFRGFTVFVCAIYFSIALVSTFQSATCSNDAKFYTGLITAMYVLMLFLVTQFMLQKNQKMRLLMNLCCCSFGYVCNMIRTWGLDDDVLPFDLVWVVGFLGLAFVSYFADFALRSAFVADRHLQKLLRVSRGRHQQATKAAMDVMLPTFVSARLLGEDKRTDAVGGAGSAGGAADDTSSEVGGDIDDDNMSMAGDSMSSSGVFDTDVVDTSKLSIADKLWDFQGVCVMFVKFGFESRGTEEHYIETIHQTFVLMEAILRRHNINKIKTIGTCLMCVNGIHNERDCVIEMVAAAIEIRSTVLQARMGWHYQIGLDFGPAMGAVLGTESLMFDLFGNTVNMASRMTYNARQHAIQVSEPVHERCCMVYETVVREAIPIKGKGLVQPYEVTGQPPPGAPGSPQGSNCSPASFSPASPGFAALLRSAHPNVPDHGGELERQ